MSDTFIPVPLSVLKADASDSVLKAGDTMTGPLILAADPTSSTEAATKNYVDTAAISATNALPTTGGTMTGALVLHADPTANLQPATKQYTDAAVATVTATAGAAGSTATTANTTASAALPRAGGTMTGALVLAGDPTSALHPATKQYADAMLPKAGGTLTGAVVLAGDPTANLHPATKQYTDAAVATVGATAASAVTTAGTANTTAGTANTNASAAVTTASAALPKAGGTMTGLLLLSGDPTSALHAVTKQYADAAIATVTTSTAAAQTDATTAISNSASAQAAASSAVTDASNAVTTVAAALPKAGGTMSGFLTLSADPSSALHAVTKQYADAQIAGAVAPKLDVNTSAPQAVTGAVTFASVATLSAGATFSGAAALAAGGSLAGTFTGTPTFSGLHTFSAGLTVSSGTLTAGTVTSTAAVQGQTGLTAGTTTTAAQVSASILAAAGQIRSVQIKSGTTLRWQFGSNATAEGGSNAGSDFFLNSYNDAGSVIGTPLKVFRATGQSLFAGPTRVNWSPVFAATPAATLDMSGFSADINASGSTDGSAWLGFNNILINSDTVDVGAAQQAIGLQINHQAGGAGVTGSRTALRSQIVQIGPALANANFQGALGSAVGQFSCGGTDLWSNAGGVLFGNASYTELTSGATNWRGSAAHEMDYGIFAGATAQSINGLQVIRWANHAYAPVIWESDSAYSIGQQATQSSGSPAAKIGFRVGGFSGGWPIDLTNGRVFGCAFVPLWNGADPMQSAHGVDFYNINLTGTQFRGKGFSVLGSGGSLSSGAVQVGGGYLSSSGATVSLDTAGSICTAASIHSGSGGANLITNTALIHDASGTVVAVTAVDANGVATAISLVSGGNALAGAIPSNPVTFRVSVPPILVTAAAFTASFASNVMTVTVAPTTGAIGIGQDINAVGVAPGTTVVSGSGSAWVLSTTPGALAARSVTGGPVPVKLDLSWIASTNFELQPSGGTLQVGSGCVAANGSVATALGSLGPAGSHTTVQEWIAIKTASGTTRYVPCF